MRRGIIYFIRFLSASADGDDLYPYYTFRIRIKRSSFKASPLLKELPIQLQFRLYLFNVSFRSMRIHFSISIIYRASLSKKLKVTKNFIPPTLYSFSPHRIAALHLFIFCGRFPFLLILTFSNHSHIDLQDYFLKGERTFLPGKLYFQLFSSSH